MPSPYKVLFNYVNQLNPPVGPTLFDPARLVYSQSSWQGGMNQMQDPTRMNPNQYNLLVNGRVRSGVIRPIKNIFQLPDSVAGNNYQGLYSAGSILLLFVDGRAYYKDVSVIGSNFQLVVAQKDSGPFSMNPQAPRIYACLVPASTVNYSRTLATASQPNSGIILNTQNYNGSIQCVICQDGSTQPWLIFNDGTCRQAQTYAQWNLTANREYIPIGTITVYINGITYVVSSTSVPNPNGLGQLVTNGNVIYRSVEGRPCDFVVNVNSDGTAGGDASTTSIAASYENITCIWPLNNSTGAFLVATANNTFTMTPDFTTTLFGEPLFDTVFLYNDGVINDKSFVNFAGNSAYIDFSGIRSFNAVQQEKFSGKNDPFSKSIQRVVDGLVQVPASCCTGQFDNYDLFAMNTVYGYGVLVYDEMLSCFVAVDLFDETLAEGDYITQFAVIKVNGYYSLYFITASNLVYQYYGDSNNFANCQLYPAEYTSLEPKIEQKAQELRLIFIDTQEKGEANLQLVVDGVASTIISNTATAFEMQSPGFPLQGIPTTFDGGNVNKMTMALDDSVQGFKVGTLISWNTNMALSHYRLECTPQLSDGPSDQQAAEAFNTSNDFNN